jgi:succinate-acetate transporter protein
MAEPITPLKSDPTANPAPLGLLAFGMTTVLLNLHNAGFYPLSGMVLGMGIFYGGGAQVIAGVLEWKKNNTFGMTAFTSYGAFWLSLVALLLLPHVDSTLTVTHAGWIGYLVMWGLFTAGLFVGTFRLSRALQVVFGSLTVLFFMLAAGHTGAGGGDGFHHLTGYEGIFCGASAIYTGLAQVLNEVYGRTVLPLGTVRR